MNKKILPAIIRYSLFALLTWLWFQKTIYAYTVLSTPLYPPYNNNPIEITKPITKPLHNTAFNTVFSSEIIYIDPKNNISMSFTEKEFQELITIAKKISNDEFFSLMDKTYNHNKKEFMIIVRNYHQNVIIANK